MVNLFLDRLQRKCECMPHYLGISVLYIGGFLGILLFALLSCIWWVRGVIVITIAVLLILKCFGVI